MTDINRRNAESVFARLAEIEALMRENQILSSNLSKLVADLMMRVITLERSEAERRIKGMGVGPTEHDRD